MKEAAASYYESETLYVTADYGAARVKSPKFDEIKTKLTVMLNYYSIIYYNYTIL